MEFDMVISLRDFDFAFQPTPQAIVAPLFWSELSLPKNLPFAGGNNLYLFLE
jgi:hypothetical protein